MSMETTHDFQEIRQAAWLAAALGAQVRYDHYDDKETASFRWPGTITYYYAAEEVRRGGEVRVEAGKGRRFRIARGSLGGRVFDYLGKSAYNRRIVEAHGAFYRLPGYAKGEVVA